MTSYEIRQAIPSDIPFIYATWLNSQKHDSIVGLSTTKTIFYEQYRQVIDYILAKTDTKVYVASMPNDPDTIFGYMVCEPDTLHYVFVKETFWNLGIARHLFETAFGSEGAGVQCTHKTKSVEGLFQSRTNLIFNPFQLYNKGSN